MLAVFPVLGGLRGPEPLERRRRVERIRRLSATSSIAQAMEQVYLPDLKKDREQENAPIHSAFSPLLLTQTPLLQRFRAEEIEAMALAMIGAVLADGHIDAKERLRMIRLLQEAGGDRKALSFLQQHLEDPIDPVDIAAKIEERYAAAEIYSAALLAIDLDSDGQRIYLSRLAKALALPQATLVELHAQAGVNPPLESPSSVKEE